MPGWGWQVMMSTVHGLRPLKTRDPRRSMPRHGLVRIFHVFSMRLKPR